MFSSDYNYTVESKHGAYDNDTDIMESSKLLVWANSLLQWLFLFISNLFIANLIEA